MCQVQGSCVFWKISIWNTQEGASSHPLGEREDRSTGKTKRSKTESLFFRGKKSSASWQFQNIIILIREAGTAAHKAQLGEAAPRLAWERLTCRCWHPIKQQSEIQNLNTASRQGPTRGGQRSGSLRRPGRWTEPQRASPSLLHPTDTHLYRLATSRIIKCF